jgi:RNA recognition motif-containing protein
MEGNKLYVGNLNYAVNNDMLTELFSEYGEVQSCNIIEGKGFGFIEMADADQANKAKEALNGSQYEGRTLKIDAARPRKNQQQRRNY